MPVVAREIWEADRERYLERVRPWVEARVRRTSRHEKHPVHDFLFEYYEFRPAQLLRWSPGFGVALAGATRDDVPWVHFTPGESGLSLAAAAFPDHRVPYLRWAIGYLEATGDREPVFGCAGMHEWAMVYRLPAPRHGQIPLRLARDSTDAVLESQPLRCTHYDAFRFFTPAAAPRNRWRLARETTTERDQPGCLHVTMDLYRFAYKIAPFCPSALVADAFEAARAAREVDMRASPYDLRALGYSPIPVETIEGRAEYAACQRELYQMGQPVRTKLLDVYRRLLSAKTAPPDRCEP